MTYSKALLGGRDKEYLGGANKGRLPSSNTPSRKCHVAPNKWKKQLLPAEP